jgi:phosphoribosylamine--glycine ligase
VEKVFCAPGNAGMTEIAENVSIGASQFSELVKFAQDNDVSLTVVGPEDPLVEGIVDEFKRAGLRIFGPPKAAARIEGSKIFAKELMQAYNIPTGKYARFNTYDQAKEYISECDTFPVVIKADGLAAGKGVLICMNQQEALVGLDDLLRKRIFGSAGDEIIIEEFLTGEEISVFVLSDGENYRLLTTSQDHKKALDGDKGKNTGGMGAYAPAPIATDQLMHQIEQEIVGPSLRALKERAEAYTGLLYIGLIITDAGPKVLEYNCRFGDPETEVVLPLLKSDLIPLLTACCDGQLAQQTLEVHAGFAIDVVLASGGYPDKYAKGKEISGIDKLPDDILVFHAGTANKNGILVTNGGRVLNVVTRGTDFERTRTHLYAHIRDIHFDDMHFRTDIGFRARNHLTSGF